VLAAQRGGGTARVGVHPAVGEDERAVDPDAVGVPDTEVAAVPDQFLARRDQSGVQQFGDAAARPT
jgi:hypothetical protein